MSSDSSYKSVGARLGSSHKLPDSLCPPSSSGSSQVSYTAAAIANCMPSLAKFLNKGDCGKICIVGGSDACAGPPFFAGDVALQCGADNVIVLTTRSAAIPLKSYSSELTVVPYLPEKIDVTSSKFIWKVWPYVNDCQAFCIGPGLGKDEVTLNAVKRLIQKIIESNTPMVLNSGALLLFSETPELLTSYTLRTPVVVIMDEVEFGWIWNILRSGDMSFGSCSSEASSVPIIINCPIAQKFSIGKYPKSKALQQTARLSSAIGSNIVIMRTGLFDITVDSSSCFIFGGELKKRCHNEGDLLSGLVTFFMSWQSLRNINDKPINAASNADLIFRLACLDAFGKKTRGIIASDVSKFIPGVIDHLASVYHREPVSLEADRKVSSSSSYSLELT